MHYILICSPFLVSFALIVASIAQWNFWLLLGVPLALLGFFFTTPGVMRGFGSWLLVLVVAGAAYNWFYGSRTTAYVLGAYAVSNFLTNVAREQCDMVIRGAVEKSEIVLVWLYLKHTVMLKSKIA